MDFSKEQIKKSAVLIPTLGIGFEYMAAAINNSADQNTSISNWVDSVFYQLSVPMQNIQQAMESQSFIDFQPIILGSAFILATKGIWESKKKYEDASDYGAYGTSRWAKSNEIYDKENISTSMKREGSILATYNGKPIIQHEDSYYNRNVAVIGSSGRGKTSAKIIPNILKHENKSIIVIDPKGELYRKTSETKRKQGYDVKLINFKDTNISDRYNPFDYIRKDSDAKKIAQTLVINSQDGKMKQDFWNLSQVSLLEAFILYVKYKLPIEKQHMGSVINIAQTGYEQMEEEFLSFPDGHIVRKAYQSALEKLQDKARSDVFATLMQTLNPWKYEDVCKFTYTSDFEFQEIGERKMIVYVMIPIGESDKRPLIASFFTQLFSELYIKADKHEGTLPRKVLLELDEFANVGVIPKFEERLATTRSLGIEVSMGIQDPSQLESRYGKEIAREILANCDVTMLFGTSEMECAKYFSSLAGKTTIKVSNESRSTSKVNSKSQSISYVGRDLITPDEVRRMGQNDLLLFLPGQYPMKLQKAWYFKTRFFKNLFGKKVDIEDYPMQPRDEYKVFSPNLLDQTKELIEEAPEEFDEEIKVDMETGEILEDAAQPEEKEESKDDDLDDLLSNFKF
jgi:type IV secretion system protein VirD4